MTWERGEMFDKGRRLVVVLSSWSYKYFREELCYFFFSFLQGYIGGTVFVFIFCFLLEGNLKTEIFFSGIFADFCII